jgi:hypothetical protein
LHPTTAAHALLAEHALALVLPLAGDYNRDRKVSAADYTVWRNSLDDIVPPGTGADGTGPAGTPDGRVDHLDYAFWKLHYGETTPMSGSGSSNPLSEIRNPQSTRVPEPPSWILMLASLTGLFVSRRSGRRIRPSFG